MRHELPTPPKFTNTESQYFQGLLGEPVSLLLGDGKVMETSAYDILTCFKDDADIDVQKPHRGYCQAISSSTVATLEEATALILFISEQPPVTPGQIWKPAELELIGQGTGGFSLVLGMTSNGPVAKSMTNHRLQNQ